MATKKASALAEKPHAKLDAAQKIAVFLEQSRLAEYVDLMNKPWRLVWLNFLSGVARGVGMVIGGGIVATLVILVTVSMLKTMLQHVGGLPWVGEQMEQAIAWVLSVAEKYKGE
jgi:hypothetical protein